MKITLKKALKMRKQLKRLVKFAWLRSGATDKNEAMDMTARDIDTLLDVAEADVTERTKPKKVKKLHRKFYKDDECAGGDALGGAGIRPDKVPVTVLDTTSGDSL